MPAAGLSGDAQLGGAPRANAVVPAMAYASAVSASGSSHSIQPEGGATGTGTAEAARCMMRTAARLLDVEQEVHHVAVLDDVVLALAAHVAGLFRALITAERDVIVVGDRLGADEAALEVGVDDPRRLRRRVADVDRPGADLLRPGREVGLQPEQPERGADEPREPGFGLPHLGEEERAVFLVHVGELG